jgi:leucyl/phenylalanyl-tRNA--protein transferase
MTVFLLSDDIAFPHPENADDSGLLAMGGDLSVERLIAAYASGIFPWYSEETPILWWSPDPRYLLFPGNLHVSRSMKKVLRRGLFHCTLDREFASVIQACSEPRPDQEGTWITQEMKEAYVDLHKAGFAHSVEVWQEDELVGGMYGVSLGNMFFGESMFSRVSNASKVALIRLTGLLGERGFAFIDAQVHTDHVVSMGAVPVPRRKFLSMLDQGLQEMTLPGPWWKVPGLSARLNEEIP